MLYIYCPFCCEKRDEQEYHYSAEAYISRPANPEEISDEEWGDYLFLRDNKKGDVWEMWEHAAGCRKFFVVKRNNVTNEIIGSSTLRAGKPLFLGEVE